MMKIKSRGLFVFVLICLSSFLLAEKCPCKGKIGVRCDCDIEMNGRNMNLIEMKNRKLGRVKIIVHGESEVPEELNPEKAITYKNTAMIQMKEFLAARPLAPNEIALEHRPEQMDNSNRPIIEEEDPNDLVDNTFVVGYE